MINRIILWNQVDMKQKHFIKDEAVKTNKPVATNGFHEEKETHREKNERQKEKNRERREGSEGGTDWQSQ